MKHVSPPVSAARMADHSVQVLTDSEVALIPREAVKKLGFERPNVGMAMWHDTLVDGSVFREWIANVGRRDAQTRIAHLLCEFSLRLKVAGLGVETDYELPMTQEQLADCVGAFLHHAHQPHRSEPEHPRCPCRGDPGDRGRCRLGAR